MEQYTTRINFLCIWVSESQRLTFPIRKYAWKMDGIGLDGSHGFGTDSLRDYEGNIQFLNSQIQIEKTVLISLGHFSGQGLRWVLESDELIPDPGYLITSDLSINVVYNGWIKIQDDEQVIDLEYVSLLYSVLSENWFGIITVHCNQRLHLLSFSSNTHSVVNVGDILFSPEYNCSMGKIIEVDSYDEEE